MKITVNIELAQWELSRAPQIQSALSELNPQAVVRFKTDTDALCDRIKDAIKTKQCEHVVTELVERLSYPVSFDSSLEVMCAVALFGKVRADDDESVASFIAVLPRLPEEMQARAKEGIVQRALAFLSKPRRLDCSRAPLLPYAETLAVMTKNGLLSIRSVIEVLVQMIEDEGTQTAGMTCLGKLVEIAYEATRSCDPPRLAELRRAVRYAQSNDVFLYDVEYIMEAFGWSPYKPALTLRRSTSHHEHPILSMAYCGGPNHREVVVTSSFDGTIGTWDGMGNLLQNVVLSRHYASCVDLTNRGHSLLVGAVGRYSNTPPAIIFYNEDGNRKAQWQEVNGTEPEDARFISGLKCLKDASGTRYCVGVRTSTANPLMIYDGARMTQSYFDHSDMITAIHLPSENENLIITGSRDCSAFIFDLRDSRNVASMTNHTNTVSCIASFDSLIFTAGLDKRLVVSDIRMDRGSIANRDMDSAVLGLSVNALLQCAVSTLTGVYVINFANGTAVPTSSHAECNGSHRRYNAIAWNNAADILFAAGEGLTLDLFAPVFESTTFEP